MSLQSPAMSAHGLGDMIDPHRSADYPVLLGDSLKEPANPNGGFVSLRYNYKPKNGLSKGKSILTKHKVGPRSSYKLIIENAATNDPAYTYSGREVSIARDDLRQDAPALALVFDKSKSAWILEPISTSLDFNLTLAPAEPHNDIHNYPQLTAGKPTQPPLDRKPQAKSTPAYPDGEDAADPSNPYDYRHFLEEAREAAEHTVFGDSRSPLPSSRTPMSGMSSPIPGASRFHQNGASTPQFRPTPTFAAVQKKRKIDPQSNARPDPSVPRSHPGTASTPKKTATQRKRDDPRVASSKPLSKERISDYDESDADADADMSDTITVARPHAKQPLLHKQSQSQSSLGTRPTSSASSSFPRSPHIVVDDPSGLEIDMGSPPSTSHGSRNRIRHVNRDAFRSQTNTPRMDTITHTRPAKRELDDDILMTDADADGDVEELELGSPRTNTRTVNSSHTSSRLQSAAPEGDEDEDDDALAAELEAALEEDEQQEATSTGIGLGISSGATDESEVSEEE